MPVKPHSDLKLIRLFWRAMLRYKPILLQSLLFPAGIILLNVVSPLFISKTLGALVTPHGQPLHYLIIFASAAGAGLMCNRFGHAAMMRWHALVMGDLQQRGLDTLMRRSVGFHNDNVGGKLVSDAIDFANGFSRVADAFATGMVPLGLTLIIGSTVIYTQSWELGLFITAVTGIIMGLGIYDSKRMAPNRRARVAATKEVTSHLADVVVNVQTVKTFSREDDEMKTHQGLNDKVTKLRLNDWQTMSSRGNNRMILLISLQIALVYTIIVLVGRDPGLLGAGIFSFTFTVTLSNRLFEVNMLIRNFEEGLLQASPMAATMEEEPEIQDRAGAPDLKVKGGEVQLKDVSFAYDDGEQHERVFSKLNLQVAPGEKIGLVGPSGGGKSTLTRLLLRFDDVVGGEILVDGQNIAEVKQASLRRAISYVPQEPLLFHRSIGENIAYGRPEADLTMIKRAAKMAHADEFIEKLGEGYETIVGERGVKLSGGQRQRVAIARAILKDAPILILDEATSALDSESEVLIQDALWRLMEKRTAIVIAHRLSTIQHMDRIIVLDDGRIVEQGTHAELLKHEGGLYTKLWSRQSGGFMDGEQQPT